MSYEEVAVYNMWNTLAWHSYEAQFQSEGKSRSLERDIRGRATYPDQRMWLSGWLARDLEPGSFWAYVSEVLGPDFDPDPDADAVAN